MCIYTKWRVRRKAGEKRGTETSLVWACVMLDRYYSLEERWARWRINGLWETGRTLARRTFGSWLMFLATEILTSKLTQPNHQNLDILEEMCGWVFLLEQPNATRKDAFSFLRFICRPLILPLKKSPRENAPTVKETKHKCRAPKAYTFCKITKIYRRYACPRSYSSPSRSLHILLRMVFRSILPDLSHRRHPHSYISLFSVIYSSLSLYTTSCSYIFFHKFFTN